MVSSLNELVVVRVAVVVTLSTTVCCCWLVVSVRDVIVSGVQASGCGAMQTKQKCPWLLSTIVKLRPAKLS